MKKVKYEVFQGWCDENYDGDFEIIKGFDTFAEANRCFEEVKKNKHQEIITEYSKKYNLITEIDKVIYEVEDINENIKDFCSIEKVEILKQCVVDFRPSVLKKKKGA